MKKFRVPPGWPIPPGRSWTPPEGWQPDPSWPAPPDRWRFWVDAKGKPVPGPIGRYGGVSRRAVSGAAAGAALFVAANLWALSAIGLIGGSGEDPAGVLADDARTVSTTPTPQPPKSIDRTPSVVRTETPSGEATPTVTSEVVRPSERPTSTEPPRSKHTSKPTKPRRTDRTPRWDIPPEYIEQCKREHPEYAWWCDPNHRPR